MWHTTELTRGHLKKIQKNKIKNSKKPRSDMRHAPELTGVHLKKFKKKIKNLKKYKNKNKKNSNRPQSDT